MQKSPIVSFNGRKVETNECALHMHYRFLGQAMDTLAFDNDAQGSLFRQTRPSVADDECPGTGIDYQNKGIANFVNKTGKMMYPGMPLTWFVKVRLFVWRCSSR
jgi:hypothetical protein